MYHELPPLPFEPRIGADTLELRHAMQRRRRMHGHPTGPARVSATGNGETTCGSVLEFKHALLEGAAADFGFGQEWL